MAAESDAERAAWSDHRPFAGFEVLTSHLAFFPGRVDACRVAEETVKPQPGGYPGGWITRNLVGPLSRASRAPRAGEPRPAMRGVQGGIRC